MPLSKSLSDEIRDYLIRSHAFAWHNSINKGKYPDEPDVVHALLADEMWGLLQELVRRRIQSATDLVIRGIFTHQTPVVKSVGETSGCEVADLMLVRLHTNWDGTSKGSSLLIQVKHTDKPETGPLTDDGDSLQLSLYRDWEPFLGVKRLPVNPVGSAKTPSDKWDFRIAATESDWRKTAEYTTVFNSQLYAFEDIDNPTQCKIKYRKVGNLFQGWTNDSPWLNGSVDSKSDSKKGIVCQEDFSDKLVDFINFKVGRPFDADQMTDIDHWSVFVREMLRIACLKNYRFGKNKLKRTDSMNLRAFSSILPIVAAQQVSDFINGDCTAKFDYVNLGIKMSRKDVRDSEPPICDESEAFPSHLPMLLILTHGDELSLGLPG